MAIVLMRGRRGMNMFFGRLGFLCLLFVDFSIED